MRCFVISPIGAPGSAVREHADDVFDFIIAPACRKAGIAPTRADHDTRPGIITEQMYDAILGHELLVAVLSFHNPNVFYELAIAEAAARPLILMIQDGDSIPFDIKDRRVLTYDLRPRALNQRVHQNALLAAIRETLAASLAQRVVPFRPSLQPLGAGARILGRTNELDPSVRLELINSARKSLDFRGIAYFNVPWRDQFFETVKRAMDRKVRPRVLLMDPRNPALEHQLRGFSSNYLKSVRTEIESGLEVWTNVLGARGEVRLQSRGFMQGMLQMNESSAILTPYSLSTATADSPLLQVDASQRLHKAARDEFDFVWKEASKPARRISSAGPKASASSAARKRARKL